MNMYESEQNKFFSQRLKKFGFSHKTLSWESPYTQQTRFLELMKVFNMTDVAGASTLLDFGCGLGHLYKFICDNGILESWKIAYSGVDINPDLIKEAKSRFSGVDFRIKDDSVFGRSFDFIVCSGIYNLKFAEDFDIGKHYTEELGKLFACAEKGVAVNFQSTNGIVQIPEKYRKEEQQKFYFFDIANVKEQLSSITQNISTAEGYLPNDFTVYLMK